MAICTKPGLCTAVKVFLALFLLSFLSAQSFAQITVNGQPGDWPAVLNNAAKKTAYVIDKQNAGTTDNIFTGGTSDVLDIPGWAHTDGSANNKNDLKNTGAFLDRTNPANPILYFFGDRFRTNGSSAIAFWFFQEDVGPLTGGTFGPGKHKAGDILVVSEFLANGGQATIVAYKWVGSGGNAPNAGGPLQTITTVGKAEVNSGNVNFGPEALSGPYAGKTWSYASGNTGSAAVAANIYPPGSFFEGSIELGGLGLNPCFQSFLVETSNSHNLTSSSEDFSAGEFRTNPNPPTVTSVAKCYDGTQLCATGSCGANNGTLIFYDQAIGGSAVQPCRTAVGVSTFYAACNIDGCESDRVPVTVTIHDNPTCSITQTGTSSPCPGDLNTYSGPAGMKTYKWTITAGNGTIEGADNAQSVSVRSGSTCGSYTLRLDITDNNDCSSFCSTIFNITDTEKPVITCPANQTIACTQTPVFGTPTATDNCDASPDIIVVSTTTTPGTCPQEYSVTRTWRATDECGNSAECSQTITVVDEVAPTITCPANATINCPATPVFGTPTATDNCDPEPRIVIVSTITTPGACPQEYSMTRTWKAVDACGNESATCSQTITVVDDVAPTITCAANRTIDCGATPNFDAPTATDLCDPAPSIVIVSTTSVNGVHTRTWKAVDACGNESATCSQILTEDVCDHFFCTNTTCLDFINGTNVLPSVCYNTQNGTLTPGVFFYRTSLTASSSSFSIVVSQTKPSGCSGFFTLGSGNQVNLLSADGASCGTNVSATFTQNSSTGAVTANVSGATAGKTYILSLKFDAKSTVTPGCKYTFTASIGGTTVPGSQGFIEVVNNCSATCVSPGATVTAVDPANQQMEASGLSVSAVPNPYNDKVRFTIESNVSGQGTLEVFNMLGQKVKTVYEGYLQAGRPQQVDFTVPEINRENLIYMLRVGKHQTTGKLINRR